MARVVTNLVSNAVKFSEGGSEVEVTVTADGHHAVLAVEDHGIGIPEAEMDQLGSRFYRASNAVDLGITGTGLGLRIVQAIVENHQGTVDLRSTQGVGTHGLGADPTRHRSRGVPARAGRGRSGPGPTSRLNAAEPGTSAPSVAFHRGHPEPAISQQGSPDGTIVGRLRFTPALAGDPAAVRPERKP